MEQTHWLYAVINKENNFVSYLSLSSNKQNSKERFMEPMTVKDWKFYKQIGYRCKKIEVIFKP